MRPLNRLKEGMIVGAVTRPAARLGAAFAQAGDLPDLAEAEQVRHDGFSAAVLIGAVGMQAVPAAPVSRSTRVTDRSLLPRNHANTRAASAFHSTSWSARHAARQAAMVAAASSGCWSNGCGGWRLSPNPARPDRPELAFRRGLPCHEPAQRFRGRYRHRPVSCWPCRSGSAPGTSERYRRRAHPRTRPSRQSPPCDPLAAAVEPARFLGNPDLDCAILAEGNVSARADDDSFLVKASGFEMASISSTGFVKVAFQPILAALDRERPAIRRCETSSPSRAKTRRPSCRASRRSCTPTC